MTEVLRLIGLDYTRFEAVDGKNLSRADTTPEDLHFLPDYRDPYHGRAMTLGELGMSMKEHFFPRE